MADYKKLCAELLDVVVKRVDHTYGDNRLMKRARAAWLPAGCWDERRWSPRGSRLVPAAAVLGVERWLRERGAA